MAFVIVFGGTQEESLPSGAAARGKSRIDLEPM